MQVAIRVSLLVQANQVTAVQHLRHEGVVFALRSRAPVDLIRLSQFAQLLGPKL